MRKNPISFERKKYQIILKDQKLAWPKLLHNTKQ